MSDFGGYATSRVNGVTRIVMNDVDIEVKTSTLRPIPGKPDILVADDETEIIRRYPNRTVHTKVLEVRASRNFMNVARSHDIDAV